MKEKEQPVALIDMDGSVAAYDTTLFKDLNNLRCPNEPLIIAWERDKEPAYLKARMDLIRSSSTWWENLPELTDGMRMVELLSNIGFRLMVCTAGPRRNADAWKGKVLWCLKHLPEGTDITITRDKGLVYGSVLMDDWPEYVESWLKHRPRGLVIMPAHDYNKDFIHPENVIRWDGSQEKYLEISKALRKIYQQKME